LPLIIEPHVGLGPALISFPKSASWRKKRMKPLFWFELLVEAELIKSKLLEGLMKACEELLKIFSKSLATARRNR